MKEKKFIKLTPFKMQVLQSFPFIDEDFDAITNYELLCKVVDYLNKTVDNVNLLESDFKELYDYVHDYFNNLDVQEEINNKLDDMAESGQLADIIAQYLGLAGVLGFNTLNDLKNATNIVDGSICKTLGNTTYNDGYGAFYKIRTMTSSDVVDGVNIVALNISNTLIAEKIFNLDVETLKFKMNLVTNKKYIMIGDSYAEGYTPDGNVTSWCENVKSFLGLNNDNCIIKYLGGSGFCATVNDRNFITLLDEVNADNSVTDIIVCGGYNDRSYDYSQIGTAINNFKTLANTKFPNAKIHVGFIGWTTNSTNLYSLYQTCDNYIRQCTNKGIHFLTNCQYSLHDYNLFSSDGIHPNSSGSYTLGTKIAEAVINGSCDVIGVYNNIHIKNLNSAISSQNLTDTLGCQLNNNIVQVSTQNQSEIEFSTPQEVSGNLGAYIKIADIDYENHPSYIIGDIYNVCKCYIPLILRTTDYKYYNASGHLCYANGGIYLKIFGMINDTNDNYRTLNINQVQILNGTHAVFESFLC